MKRIDIEIWKYLLERRNEDVCIGDMCSDLCMTRREMISRVTRAALPYVSRVEQTSSPMHYRMECSLEEAELATEQILSDFFNIPEKNVSKAVSVLSEAGSMTLDDVSELSGLDPRYVAYILQVSPMVSMTKIGSKNQYVKITEDQSYV